MTAKDFFGFELQVGDDVAFAESSSHFLVNATVKEITEKGTVVQHEHGKILLHSENIIKRVLKPEDLRLLKFTIGSKQ